MVLIMFSQDTVVVPRESEWFGHYADGSNTVLLPYNETTLYKQDSIGLQTLDKTGNDLFILIVRLTLKVDSNSMLHQANTCNLVSPGLGHMLLNPT